MKTCTLCKKNKELTFFNKDCQKKTGISSVCRECASSRRKQGRLKNIEKYRNKDKERTLKRKEWKKEYDLKRYKRLKNELNKKNNLRYRTDILFKLRLNLRRRMYKFVKRKTNGKGKGGSAVKDLGCDLTFFKTYLESKFQEGMSWDNYGKWHLDHIYPLSLVDVSDREQFLKVAHYTNYQPLWAIDNIKKGNKVN